MAPASSIRTLVSDRPGSTRWPTTATSIVKLAACAYDQFLLATDLLAVAERPIDPSGVTS